MPGQDTPTLENQDAENDQSQTTGRNTPFDGRRQSHRDEIVDSIVARRHEDLEEDMADDDYQREFDEPEDKEKEPETKDPEVKEPEKKEPEDSEKIPVKVNGKTYEVTPQEIAEYQKQRAADERFREIAQERERLRQEREEFERQRQQSQQPADQTPEKPETSEDAKSLAEALIQATYSEDVDEVAKIISGLTQKQQNKVIERAEINPQKIYEMIDQRDRQRELNASVRKFESEYPVLARDFRSAVDERTVIEMEADPHASPWEIIDRAAKHVQNAIESMGGVKKEEPKKPAQAPASTPRSKATRRFQPAPPKQRVSAFEEIKRARGQAL